MKSFILSLVVITTLGFSGCGGSGGDSGINTVDTNVTYNMKNIYVKNYSFNAPLKSSENNDTFEYLLSATVKDQTTINGITLVPVDFIGSIENKTTGIASPINNTLYYTNNGIKYQTVNNDDGTICSLTNTPTSLSDKAKIGDSGIGSTLECTDGTKSTESWVLVTKNNETAVKTISVSYDASNAVSFTLTEFDFITTNGIITKSSFSIYYNSNNLTLTVPITTLNLR